MTAFFRRATKSTVGTILMLLFVVAIAASFALADVQSYISGGLGQAGTLAKVGCEAVTERELGTAMQPHRGPRARRCNRDRQARAASPVGHVAARDREAGRKRPDRSSTDRIWVCRPWLIPDRSAAMAAGSCRSGHRQDRGGPETAPSAKVG